MLAVVFSRPALSMDKNDNIFYNLNKIQYQLGEIKFHMGKTFPRKLKLEVKDAGNREVYLASLNLLHKADRLCYDLTGKIGTILPQKENAPNINFINKNLILTQNKLFCVYKSISKMPIKLNPPRKKTEILGHNEALLLMLELSRQLNTLSDNPHNPSTVFIKIQNSIDYIERILKDTYNKVPREPLINIGIGKKPVDVFFLMLETLKLIRIITKKKNFNTFELSLVNEQSLNILPGDVYELASLLIVETKFLERMISGTNKKEIKKIRYPGRKFPTDVYKKTKRLTTILKILKYEMETRKQL